MSYIHLAWGFALLVLTGRAMREASKSGTSNEYRFPRLFYMYRNHLSIVKTLKADSEESISIVYLLL